MRRRTLLKLMALLPWFGPTMAKALTKADPKPVVYGPYLPASFPKWDKAVDGLESAAAWSSGIERTRLPKGLVVPGAGEIWEAARDCEVNLRVRHNDPYSPKLLNGLGAASSAAHMLLFGGQAQLRQGERIRIIGVDDARRPLFVTFEPVRYEELQTAIVAEEARRMPGYGGYELQMRSARTIAYIAKRDSQAYFNETFKFVG